LVFTGAMTTSDDTPGDPHGDPYGRPHGEPADPVSMPGQPPPPPPGQWTPGPMDSTGLTSEERNWAVAAHLGSFLAAWVALGLLAPLAVLLLKSNDSAFIRRHAVESLNFQINALVYTVVFGILIIFLIGLVLLPLYGIFYLICVILASVRASHGEEYRYPLTLRFIT